MSSLKEFAKHMSSTNRSSMRPIITLIFINSIIAVFQLAYLNLRFSYLNTYIPLWYTKPWGEIQLAQKSSIFLIPATALVITTLGGAFTFIVNVSRKYFKYGSEILFTVVTGTNAFLTLSLLRIMKISSTPYPPLVNPLYLDLVIPFAISFLITYLIAPKIIELAEDKKLVTDPNSHFHPAMILKNPTARAGGVIFTTSFIVTSFLFIQLNTQLAGVLLVTVLISLFGLLDDYQNTHMHTKLNFLEAPNIRLPLLLIIVSIVTAFGVKIGMVNNPFDGIWQLDTYKFILKGREVQLISTAITTLWIVWLLNLLSWSNGVDGQYSGIVGITGFVIAVLALRFVPLESIHLNAAKMSIIAAGASLGLVPFTWHPSKVLWGFGAMAAGFSIASISILINAKITTSIIILIVPFLDASVTIGRRILQGNNPLKGDRGHLHHLLLDRGWSIPQIATFYWVTTGFFGIIGISFAEKLTFQAVLAIVGFVSFFIILLNLRSISEKRRSQ